MQKNSKRSRLFQERREGLRVGQPVLIVCEGETECVYLRELKQKWRLSAVTIEGSKCAPISVVEHALQERKNGDYDSVWCVIDRDGHESYSRAINQAEDNKLNVIKSIPCFEVWIFLHFGYSTRPCKTYKDVEKLLKNKKIKAIIGKYEKTKLPMPELMERMDTAIKNATKLRNDAVAAESFFTNVDELVIHLQSLSTPNRMPKC